MMSVKSVEETENCVLLMKAMSIIYRQHNYIIRKSLLLIQLVLYNHITNITL